MHTKPILPPEVRRELRAIVKRDSYEYFTLFDHLSEALEAVDGSGRSPHLLSLLEEIFAVFDDPGLAKRKAARVAANKELARLADAEAAERALEDYLRRQAQKSDGTDPRAANEQAAPPPCCEEPRIGREPIEEAVKRGKREGAAFRRRMEARIDEALEQGEREGEELRERLEARPWPDPTTLYRAGPDSEPDADDIAARAAANREVAQLWVEANEAAREMEEYLQSQARPDDGTRYLQR